MKRWQRKHFFESSKYPRIKPTDVSELRALIGLLCYRGLYEMKHHSLKILFSDKAAMSRDRIRFLLLTLRFDDPAERKEKWSCDRVAVACPIFQMFNSNTSKYLLPSLYQSIDKTLYTMRHWKAFREYNPSKPHKYGLLLKSLPHSPILKKSLLMLVNQKNGKSHTTSIQQKTIFVI